MEKREIVKRFADAGFLVHPDVVTYVFENQSSGVIEGIISALPSGTIVVTPSLVSGMAVQRNDKLSVGLSDIPSVISGREGNSIPLGNPEDSVKLFKSRYELLSNILKGRVNPIPIEALLRNANHFADKDISICGMVVSFSTSKNGHRIVEIDDSTGAISVLFHKDDENFHEAERIVYDEVIGIKGSIRPNPGGRGGMVFVKQFFRPDIPRQHAPSLSKEPGKVCMISDVHVGSNTFLPDAWERFTCWLEEHPEIGYLLIDGDVVDGIGIYPDQDKELEIKTIFEQYDRVGEMLAELPKHMQIVLAPGNHDAVRGAEPQPALPEEFRSKFRDNVTFVENPASVSIQGVTIQMYHGRSIDDLIKAMPGASYEKSGEVMKAMLQRRHMAPIYGQRTPLLSTEPDHLVINKIPDIFQTGHVHISDIIRYNGVLGVNAGTWQSQTSFQKEMDINPTPAEAVVVDLSTLEYDHWCFLDKKVQRVIIEGGVHKLV
ncbi:MAG TPA: DNA-directed DNA polymerase II small subunit [Methanocorpusculum sp.]|nr:DNA-directed DNA polymerase II small subunit [Methanocorpusculum sp.]